MKTDTDISANPVDRYVACFPSCQIAAAAAGVSTEMLRRMRRCGFVTTRKRALLMARACGFRVDAIELLGLSGVRRSARAPRPRNPPAE
ncbi:MULTISPECIES: hypothetical protein [unclassified Lysobacter]|uniref:hypothetical protein n=1 Tax=unclassified Lysobacter TaxID=2635362 RepID=UPI001C2368D1|nr:hypothetical protein [Lysobacter sp. MMG2]MBU8977972.1 hypothetical protein [Lysobacter sp. MMG2]